MYTRLLQTSAQTRDKNAAISSNAQKSRVSPIYRKTLQRFSSPDFSDGDISDGAFYRTSFFLGSSITLFPQVLDEIFRFYLT